jgi:hypothetical protein
VTRGGASVERVGAGGGVLRSGADGTHGRERRTGASSLATDPSVERSAPADKEGVGGFSRATVPRNEAPAPMNEGGAPTALGRAPPRVTGARMQRGG